MTRARQISPVVVAFAVSVMLFSAGAFNVRQAASAGISRAAEILCLLNEFADTGGFSASTSHS